MGAQAAAEGARDGTGGMDGVSAGMPPFHMVGLHPIVTMFMTGEKDRHLNDAPPPGDPMEEHHLTLRLFIHRFDHRIHHKYANQVFVDSFAVAFNDDGIHFSPCPSMLAT